MVVTTQVLDVEEAIFTTRAVRRLRPDPVPDAVVWAVLDAAIRGPSGGNAQRWGWVVVADPAVKACIGAWYREAWDGLRRGRRQRLRAVLARLTRGRVPADNAEPDDVNYRSGQHLAQHIAEAPVWIVAVVCGVPGQPSLADGADIFGAVQNLMLAARKHGLGTTLTMLHRRREAEVMALLGLPADARPVALVPMGYPESGPFGPAQRRPVESVVHWGRWGATRPRLDGRSLSDTGTG